MPAKKAKSVKSLTKHQIHSEPIELKLTPEFIKSIEGQLSKCSKSGTNVLLYGKDSIDSSSPLRTGREELVLKVHKLNGGIDAALEYFDDDGRSVSREDFAKKVHERAKIPKEYRHEPGAYHSGSSKKTYVRIDCMGMTAEEVYKELVISSSINRELEDYENAMENKRPQNYLLYKISKKEFKDFGSAVRSGLTNNKGSLFACYGLVFVDNVTVHSNDNLIYFDKLARIIKRKGAFDNHPSFEWLIVYTSSDPKNFPEGFRDQFTVISLEPEGQKTDLEQNIVESDGFLDNANYLHVGSEKIRISPSHAELVRYMAKELKKNKCLDISDILFYHYGDDVRNKMILSKKERKPFDNEASKINKKCYKVLKRDLIKSLGNKKYTLSLPVRIQNPI